MICLRFEIKFKSFSLILAGRLEMDGSALKKVRGKLIAPLGLPPLSNRRYMVKVKLLNILSSLSTSDYFHHFSTVKPNGIGKKRDYTPIHWSQYFVSSESIVVNEGDTFHVYRRGDSGPLLVLLHGGGFSALTWALFTVIKHPLNRINRIYETSSFFKKILSVPLFVGIHCRFGFLPGSCNRYERSWGQ